MSVDFLAIATQAGKQAGTVEQNVSGALTPQHVEQLRSRGMSYTNVLDLAPGVYSVRFVVRDNLSGRIGTVNAPLTVN